MSLDDAVSVPAPLFDQSARDAIRNDHRSTLFVEAGAGTGKTSELVNRIVALVRSGSIRLRNLGAITFTEAAASELRERVREALRTVVEEERDVIAMRALDELDDAAMTTIHGFCQRILAEHPLEAGLPLRFVVVDEVASSLRFERRFGEFLDEIYDEEALRPVLAAAQILGIGSRQLRALARRIDEQCERFSMNTTDPALGDRLATLVQQGVEELCRGDDKLHELATACADPSDRLLARLEELSEDLARLASGADWREQLASLVVLRARRVGNLGKRASWVGVDVQLVRETLHELGARRDEIVALVCDVVIRAIGDRLSNESLLAASARRRDGELRYDDLLSCCRDLLASDRRVLEEVRSRYRAILVDEFQDTDPLQLEIVTILSRDESGNIEPGRLFFVGDPKQSIYRFRGADVALYERARTEFADNNTLQLQSNFRSVPGVLALCNAVFEPLMGADRYRPLVAVRPANPDVGQPVVTVLGGPLGDDTRAAARRSLEAREVVGAIEMALVEKWPVVSEETSRPARLSDIAILVPRRSGLYELEQALEDRQLSYRVESSTLIYASREVRDLLALLRVLARPYDESAIVAALRTPAIGASDEELYSFREAGGEWSLRSQRGVEGRVHDGLQQLIELSAYSVTAGPVEILSAIVEQFHIGPLFAASRRPSEALRRLRFIESRVRAFEAAGGRELEELVSFMELEAEQGVRGVEAAVDDGEDALQIFTVHGAKGLEFPIVVLAELGGDTSESYRGPGVFFGPRGVEFGLARDRATCGYLALREAEDDFARAEMVRIGYVACTRARDHLVISLLHKKASSEQARSLAERISICLDGRDELVVRRPIGGEVLTQARGLEQARVEGLETKEAFELALVRHEQSRAGRAVVATVAASQLEAEIYLDRRESGGEDPIGLSRRRAASGFGRAVHKVLQLVELDRPDNLEQLAVVAAREERCEARAEEVAARVRLGLATAVVKRAIASPRRFKEMPFTVSIDDGYLEGVLDLCYLEGDRFVIVDYKTDALHDAADIEKVAMRYRLQAGAYALGLKAVTQREVDKVVLVLLGLDGHAFEYVVEDLDEACDAARQAISARLGRSDMTKSPN